MKLLVETRSGKSIGTLDVVEDLPVKQFKKKFHALKKKYHPSRQRFTLPLRAGEKKATVLEDSKTLRDYGLQDGSVLHFKDLGMQVGYSTVFFWEYFGPLLVYPLFYALPQLMYPGMRPPAERPLVQTLALAYWSLHYTKRIAETFLVHKFGHETMPVFNLVRNCLYYWGFAAFVSYFNNHPRYTAPPLVQTQAALALALLCQLANWRCHVILANLRKPGEKGYKIPRGFLFNFITCANYTAEIWGWTCFSVAVQALPAAIFTLVGAAQMTQWALQKHARLRKTFDGKEGREKYPRRWIVLPPLL
ncbi:3-oxo-5-alpha-steroid 4-dehydrogenase-domain-containing protein [Haematococcus lacustris]